MMGRSRAYISSFSFPQCIKSVSLTFPPCIILEISDMVYGSIFQFYPNDKFGRNISWTTPILPKKALKWHNNCKVNDETRWFFHHISVIITNLRKCNISVKCPFFKEIQHICKVSILKGYHFLFKMGTLFFKHPIQAQKHFHNDKSVTFYYLLL